MRNRGKIKYFLIFFLCFSIFTYGFFQINFTKAEDVQKESMYAIHLTIKPVKLEIDTKDYNIYVDDKFIDIIKAKYNDIYNRVFSK
jgi:hypothetical protein